MNGSRLARVAVGAVATAMLLGAVYLGWQSVQNSRLRCEDGGHEECAFIEQTAREVARTQALFAAGCALLGGGLLLYLRSFQKGDVP